MRITYRPHVRRKYRVHGYLKRMRTHNGRNIFKRRRSKGRYRLSV
ncbi:MAG: 50S ribosomal protein L34 [Caldisericia bacterium]|jgi:large subunit ribosomal protein L34|nr:50S ribosomal protein L34 [Caldisericia bacterium]MDD3427711.1 50S ribosomal protein L34 [Caldisericia bacterium]MDD5689066.1 50S ribosomal protein L34 [Caldisericia bacterium]HOJ16259.1 50S ribosomal protein L34 [Caldisericia bacterium]HOW02725.1 50S ribosomal protein L34 [Caldisericia bacterium]